MNDYWINLSFTSLVIQTDTQKISRVADEGPESLSGVGGEKIFDDCRDLVRAKVSLFAVIWPNPAGVWLHAWDYSTATGGPPPCPKPMRRARGREQMKHFQKQKTSPSKHDFGRWTTPFAHLILKWLERFKGVRLCTVITAVPIKAMSFALIQLRNGLMCTEVCKFVAFWSVRLCDHLSSEKRGTAHKWSQWEKPRGPMQFHSYSFRQASLRRYQANSERLSLSERLCVCVCGYMRACEANEKRKERMWENSAVTGKEKRVWEQELNIYAQKEEKQTWEIPNSKSNNRRRTTTTTRRKAEQAITKKKQPSR